MLIIAFQFLHGAIKGFKECGWLQCEEKFQFLHGAIKGKIQELAGKQLDIFQFLHGAIKGLSPEIKNSLSGYISIPTWCD